MRQFVAEVFPDAKGCIYIEGKNYKYLVSVLRSREGDMINVRLPDGLLQPMTLAKIDAKEKRIILQIAGEQVKENQASALQKLNLPSIYLFQFVARPANMDLIIRQAVECGVEHIVPVSGKFCQKGCIDSACSASKSQRWQRIVTEARQQSGSPVETIIHPVMSVEEAGKFWVKESGGFDSGAIVLYEQTAGTVTIQQGLEKKDIKRAAVAVGAEGGIDMDEVNLLAEAGFTPVHLNTNILRCETASIYGVAALETILG